MRRRGGGGRCGIGRSEPPIRFLRIIYAPIIVIWLVTDVRSILPKCMLWVPFVFDGGRTVESGVGDVADIDAGQAGEGIMSILLGSGCPELAFVCSSDQLAVRVAAFAFFCWVHGVDFVDDSRFVQDEHGASIIIEC